MPHSPPCLSLSASLIISSPSSFLLPPSLKCIYSSLFVIYRLFLSLYLSSSSFIPQSVPIHHLNPPPVCLSLILILSSFSTLSSPPLPHITPKANAICSIDMRGTHTCRQTRTHIQYKVHISLHKQEVCKHFRALNKPIYAMKAQQADRHTGSFMVVWSKTVS